MMYVHLTFIDDLEEPALNMIVFWAWLALNVS